MLCDRKYTELLLHLIQHCPTFNNNNYPFQAIVDERVGRIPVTPIDLHDLNTTALLIEHKAEYHMLETNKLPNHLANDQIVEQDMDMVISELDDTDDDEDHVGSHSVLKEEQLKLYDHLIFGRIRGADVFYLSAISSWSRESNQSGVNQPNKTPTTITFNGWLGKIKRNNTIYCCLAGLSPDKQIKAKLIYWNIPKVNYVKATKFVCDISAAVRDGQRLPLKAGLNHNPKCWHTHYIDIAYPVPADIYKEHEATTKNESTESIESTENTNLGQEETTDGHVTPSKGTFAICAKVVYGQYDAEKVFEWFEINKAFGVDHVALFTYNVSREIKEVLTHYEKTGFVTVNEFDFPLNCKYEAAV